MVESLLMLLYCGVRKAEAASKEANYCTARVGEVNTAALFLKVEGEQVSQ